MPIEILMPALSPTMTEGTLAKWLKKEGDQVSSGDAIAEIETDKATMEVEAADDGVLGRIVVPEGTANVKVNEVIALLLGEGENASSLDKQAAKPADKPEAASSTAKPTAESTAAPRSNGHAAPSAAAGLRWPAAGRAIGTARRRACSPARWRAAWQARPASISPAWPWHRADRTAAS